jgi:hypothetical protein
MNRRSILIGAVWLAAGCASSPQPAAAPRSPAAVPVPFTLELQALGESRKVAYRLDANGDLAYSGGRDAVAGEPAYVGRLNDQQIADLWAIVRDRRLLDASGAGLFATGQKVKYQVKLRAAGRSHHFSAVDDQNPALAELDHALFQLASNFRYNSVFKPIDEQIRKSGGSVKQQHQKP